MSEWFEQLNYTFILRPKQKSFLGAADSRQCRKIIAHRTLRAHVQKIKDVHKLRLLLLVFSFICTAILCE